jgi:ABC-type Mn2+/Zn2+ transport system permease subunit
MITKIYAIVGTILLVVMGIAWLKGSDTLDQNTLNGMLSLALGGFGLIYVLVKSLKKVSKKEK